MKRNDFTQKLFFPEERMICSNKDIVILFDNVQFIYELALAQLELYSFDIKFQIKNGLREFELLSSNNLEEFRRRTAYFKLVSGKYSIYYHIMRENITRSVNQYLTHWIYPYKGKFHPQMIRALLNIIKAQKGDIILDPFVGSGTTALEAQLLGINCLGIDISPLCVLQSRVKTESIDVIKEIEECSEEVLSKRKSNILNPENIDLIACIESIPNEKVRNFYWMAYLVAISDNVRRGRDLEHSFCKNISMMIESVKNYRKMAEELNLELGQICIQTGDARSLPLPDESVDGIITSPPYSIALDYVTNDAHALRTLGVEIHQIREEFIGVRGKGARRIGLYNDDMRRSYEEMYRVLKPQKFAAIVIGNATYMGQEVNTVSFTINYCQSLGFELVKNIDKIIFGLYNVMQKENILLFQKI